MSDVLPEPLVPSEVDVRDLDGFMLNVERLMASELVALSSHEVVAAALFLWCRAWKQIPAASLPDDDRVIAAFARLPLARFKRLRAEVLRGFVKCSDGRIYHKVLGKAAVAAYGRKRAFCDRREKDNERLRQWRAKPSRTANDTESETRHETPTETKNETRSETNNETRFERSVEGEGEGEGYKKRKNAPPPFGDDANPGGAAMTAAVTDPQAELFRRGREVLGSSAGGLVKTLLKSRHGSIAQARAAIETASEKGSPKEYIGAIIAGRDRDVPNLSARDRGDAW